jgi:ubiquinone/menaquinone biosynthesis C-methylase UbiE
VHFNSKLLFQKYAKHLFKSNMRVLEIGPNSHPSDFQAILNDASIKWETLDIFQSEKLTYVAENEYSFPIPDNSFDIVISAQVIEHVREIWTWMKELSRVCKVNGFVITINPVSYPYHEAPVDCWRIYPEGMKALYSQAGLDCQLSVTETLEVDPSQYIVFGEHRVPLGTYDSYRQTFFKKIIGKPVLVPGVSIDKSGYKQLIKRFLGMPVQCSVDTITIGIKDQEKIKDI